MTLRDRLNFFTVTILYIGSVEQHPLTSMSCFVKLGLDVNLDF